MTEVHQEGSIKHFSCSFRVTCWTLMMSSQLIVHCHPLISPQANSLEKRRFPTSIAPSWLQSAVVTWLSTFRQPCDRLGLPSVLGPRLPMCSTRDYWPNISSVSAPVSVGSESWKSTFTLEFMQTLNRSNSKAYHLQKKTRQIALMNTACFCTGPLPILSFCDGAMLFQSECLDDNLVLVGEHTH